MITKYRAWEYRQNRMLGVSAINYDENGVVSAVCYAEPGDKIVLLPDEMALMAYIDADDLEGKPVAEGDIVQHRARPEFSGIVRFAKGGFFAVGKTKTDDRKEVWSGSFIERQCDIRGNAYQNPELMDWFVPAPPPEPRRLPRPRKVIDAEIVEPPKKRGKK